MRSFNRPENRLVGKGFSLVELLVVIAIISILAAMLLPALEKALNQARTISCLNRLKQIMVATICYGGDNSNNLMNATDAAWPQYDHNIKDNVSGRMTRQLLPYIETRNLMICPDLCESWQANATAYIEGTGDCFGYMYWCGGNNTQEQDEDMKYWTRAYTRLPFRLDLGNPHALVFSDIQGYPGTATFEGCYSHNRENLSAVRLDGSGEAKPLDSGNIFLTELQRWMIPADSWE